MKDVRHESRQRLIGIALMCAAVALFALLDTTAKYLSAEMSTSQIVAARYVTAFLLAMVLVNPVRYPRMMVTRRPVFQAVRSMLMLGTTILNFIAVRYLQLDQTLSIMFSAPFLVALLAGPFLGESLDWRRWAAILVGFIGVLLVTRPGLGGIHPAAFLMFAAAMCYAVYGIMTRALARTDSNETTLFYTNLVGVICMLPVLPFVWTLPQDAFSWVLMMIMGLLGGTGHYLLIIAHRLAPASVLSPFIYSQMIWMIALGYFVFGDVPSYWTLTGAAIVIASGLYLIQRERRRRRIIPPAPDIVG